MPQLGRSQLFGKIENKVIGEVYWQEDISGVIFNISKIAFGGERINCIGISRLRLHIACLSNR